MRKLLAVLLGLIVAFIFYQSYLVLDSFGESLGAPVIIDGEPEAPLCDDVMGLDGFGGFLWKAESDVTGNLVVIFPTEYQVEFDSVTVVRTKKDSKSGCLVDRKRPVTDACVPNGFANGNRQHWLCPYPGEYYDGRVFAILGGSQCEWRVPCPGRRQD